MYPSSLRKSRIPLSRKGSSRSIYYMIRQASARFPSQPTHSSALSGYFIQGTSANTWCKVEIFNVYNPLRMRASWVVYSPVKNSASWTKIFSAWQKGRGHWWCGSPTIHEHPWGTQVLLSTFFYKQMQNALGSKSKSTPFFHYSWALTFFSLFFPSPDKCFETQTIFSVHSQVPLFYYSFSQAPIAIPQALDHPIVPLRV